MKYYISGFLLILLSVWGAAIGMNYFTTGAFDFATYFTAVLIGFLGFFLVIKGIEEL